MDTEPVTSPCVNVCELGDDNICQGCFRSLDEIGDWSYADNSARAEIVAHALQRKSQSNPQHKSQRESLPKSQQPND